MGRLLAAREMMVLEPTVVRCQALAPGKLSRHLHSTQPRTWQARFVDFRTAADCALSRGPRSRSVFRNLRWSFDGPSRSLRRFAYPTIPSRAPREWQPSIRFVATRCGDEVFLWHRSTRPLFSALVAKKSQAFRLTSLVWAGSSST